MIIKALGVSSLIYSASNINVPKDIISNVKGRLLRFIWKNKRDKIRREGLYQDYDKNGLRVSDYFFKKYGARYFLLSCNYDFENVPSFYKDILLFFHELKALYGCHHGQDTILCNNKEIRIDGKPFFWKGWFEKGMRTIKDLLDKNGNVLSLPVFQSN